MDVVVKLAILPFQRTKMRHEYSIYRHLAPFHIKGIPQVHGLFEDVEDSAMALVMSPCGSDLEALYPSPSKMRDIPDEQQ